MVKDIETIRILNYKYEAGDSKADKVWKKIEKAASDESYTEIMNVSAEGVQVNLYMIKGLEGRTREVAMILNAENSIMLFTMTGNMDFSAMFSHENMQAFRQMGEYFMEHKGSCEGKTN
jgi:hypothetical protein